MMSEVTQHNYLLAIEAAAVLRCHPRTVARMIRRGEIRATVVAGSYRILRFYIEAMLPGGAA
jgi:excisionase family DNA binding protein